MSAPLAWYRLPRGFTRRADVRRLAAKRKCSRAEAAGLVVGAIDWYAEQAPDGRLAVGRLDDLAEDLGRGEGLVSELLEAGVLRRAPRAILLTDHALYFGPLHGARKRASDHYETIRSTFDELAMRDTLPPDPAVAPEPSSGKDSKRDTSETLSRYTNVRARRVTSTTELELEPTGTEEPNGVQRKDRVERRDLRGDVKAFLSAWADEFKKRFGAAYGFRRGADWGKATSAVKLLDGDADLWRSMCALYLRLRDEGVGLYGDTSPALGTVLGFANDLRARLSGEAKKAPRVADPFACSVERTA